MDQFSDALLDTTLRQFQVFVVAAQAGGFGLAAERLDIAQPSVSAHIQSLEAELGVTLFHRRAGRRPVLTEAGHILLHHAGRTLAEIKELQSRLAPRPPRGEEVILACQRSLATAVLPVALAQFASEHPEMQLVTRIGTQEDVLAHLESGVADLACFFGDDDLNLAGSRKIGSERFIVIAAPTHPLTRLRHLTSADISGQAFVGPPDGTILGRQLRQMLAAAGVATLNMVSRATEHPLLREMVMAGVGLACCSERSARAELDQGRIVALSWDHELMALGIRLAASKVRRPSPTARRLAACIEASCQAGPLASRGHPATLVGSGDARRPSDDRQEDLRG